MIDQLELSPEEEAVILDIYNHPEKLGWLLGYKDLNEQHGKWIKRCHEATETFTLQAHRGAYKTAAITTTGTIWGLFFYPDTRYLIASSTDTNVKLIMDDIRIKYDQEPLRSLYKIIGVDEPKNKKAWNKESFTLSTKTSVSKEGSVGCSAPGGTITSRHYDKIICDDISTIKDRYSPAKRFLTKTWVMELQSIIDPGGVIMYIGTPWHKDDVFSITPTAEKYPLWSIDIAGLTPEIIEEKKKVQTKSYFAAQYLLEHIQDSSGLFRDFKYIEDYNIDEMALQSFLDPAFTESEEADYSALPIGGMIDEKLVVVYGDIWQTTIPDTYNKVEGLYQNYGVRSLSVESNQSQKVLIYEFEKRGLRVEAVHHSKNKFLRIQDSLLKNWENVYFTDGCTEEFLAQIENYTEFTTEHDDAPDALASLCDIFFGGSLAQVETIDNLPI